MYPLYHRMLALLFGENSLAHWGANNRIAQICQGQQLGRAPLGYIDGIRIKTTVVDKRHNLGLATQNARKKSACALNSQIGSNLVVKIHQIRTNFPNKTGAFAPLRAILSNFGGRYRIRTYHLHNVNVAL